jgi:signal transduction histidine kinase
MATQSERVGIRKALLASVAKVKLDARHCDTCPSVATLEKREHQREEWVSLVAHDLKQPLNTIALGAQLLARSPRLNGTDTEEISRILWAARAMSRQVSDLLDASLIDARRMRVECMPVTLPALVEGAMRHLPELAGRCRVDIEPGAEAPVRADADRVEQVLGNLLSNAAKYGTPGTEIAIAIAPCDAVEGAVRTTVSNHGAGIPPHELPRVFDRYRRCREARRAPRSGLGLGLYIARGLIEAQGGRIWAESIPGLTTRFHFTLPLVAR